MSHSERITVGDRGRIVLPAPVRSKLGLTPGTRLALTIETDGSLRLRPYRAVADQARGLYSQVREKRGSLVDDLLEDRARRPHARPALGAGARDHARAVHG